MPMKLSTKKILWSTMTMILVSVGVLWMIWPNTPTGWGHLVGLGLSVALLILIWTWPGIRQPTKPPL
jgi:hypothetical protein